MTTPSLARALLPAALLLLGACARPAPSTDSAAATVSAADSGIVSATPPAAVGRDSGSARAAGAPDTAVARRGDTTPADRPRLTPRAPHPVPLPMPGRGRQGPAIQPAGAGDQASDQAVLDRLRTEARALAHVDGCASAGECAVQPIGARACGGPSEYLVYCPKSTDVAALKRKAAEIDRADRAFNAKYELMSTCEYRLAPTAQLVGGQCKAAPAGRPMPGPDAPR